MYGEQLEYMFTLEIIKNKTIYQKKAKTKRIEIKTHKIQSEFEC